MNRDRERDRNRDRDRGGDRDRCKARDRDRERDRDRDRGRDENRESGRNRDDRGRDNGRDTQRDREYDRKRDTSPKPASKINYSEVIPGFDNMTPSEKVKAKMNLQLNKLSTKEEPQVYIESAKGPGSRGWERFSFDQSAPLDDRLDDDLDDTAKEIREAKNKIRGGPSLSARDREHEDAIFGRLHHAPPPIKRTISPSPSPPSSPFDNDTDDIPHKRLRTNAPIPERPKNETEKTEKNDKNDENELASTQVASQQQNGKNAWLRKMESLRNKARSAAAEPPAETEPITPARPEKYKPVTFQIKAKK